MYIVNSFHPEDKRIKTIYVSETSFSDAKNFIENLKSFKVEKDIINITSLREDIPTDSDTDGYYMIRDSCDSNHYDLYQKKTNIHRGYIYNSASVEINKIVSFFINDYQPVYQKEMYCSKVKKFNFNTNISDNSQNSHKRKITRTYSTALMDELKNQLEKRNNQSKNIKEETNRFINAFIDKANN